MRGAVQPAAMSDFKVGERVWDGAHVGVLTGIDDDDSCSYTDSAGWENVATLKDLMHASNVPATWKENADASMTPPRRSTRTKKKPERLLEGIEGIKRQKTTNTGAAAAFSDRRDEEEVN